MPPPAPVLVLLAAGQGRRFGGIKPLAPVGPHGEAVMDYSIHDALTSGFRRVVVVVRPEIDSVIRDHLQARWGPWLPISYAHQPVAASGRPGGTAPALLSARALVADAPFAVVNTDDLYGPTAFQRLHEGLVAGGGNHKLAGYRLEATILPGGGPVNRALCDCRPDGTLERLIEAAITARPDGRWWATPMDGGTPEVAAADRLVSMNAWGFGPDFWPQLDKAVRAGPARAESSELLLPGVVGCLLGELGVDVLPVPDRCLSVTWPSDLAAVRGEVSLFIASGRYPERLGGPRG